MHVFFVSLHSLIGGGDGERERDVFQFRPMYNIYSLAFCSNAIQSSLCKQ